MAKPGSDLATRQLRAFLRDKLAVFEQPRRIELCDELPKTLMGKPSRRTLVALDLARQAAGQRADDEEPVDAEHDAQHPVMEPEA